jgi:hypothetical protein
MNEIDIVRDISGKFEQANIPYMLTGSMAMNYYAQPRMTRDIDVVIALGPDDVARVAALFRPDYYVSEENIRESLADESIFNLIHHESVIKVDCIIRKQIEYRQVEFERPDDLHSRLQHLRRQQRGSHHLKTLLGERFAFRASTGRCPQSARDRIRRRLFAALDARTWAGYFIGGMSRMNDTPPEIARMVRDKLMARSGEERFVMGAQMFESARQMVEASLPPGLSERERRRQLFKRFYGKEIGIEN